MFLKEEKKKKKKVDDDQSTRMSKVQRKFDSMRNDSFKFVNHLTVYKQPLLSAHLN